MNDSSSSFLVAFAPSSRRKSRSLSVLQYSALSRPTTTHSLLLPRNLFLPLPPWFVLKIWCLVNGISPSTAFSVDVDASATVGHLQEAVKATRSPRFDDIAAHNLTLWRISIPVNAENMRNPVLLSAIDSPTELDPMDDIADVFAETPPKKTCFADLLMELDSC
ncbi:hypothetical protein B0O80DRAFT_96814 [Mortierella sp. GBAus27b]|nr:hypothetical protein B0O80DRAFT_96814 [Mortierella sp. GBAus27b]